MGHIPEAVPQGALAIRKESMKQTHGQAHRGRLSPEYNAYRHAKARCTNPKHRQWADWGGRGIKFLFTDFAQFFAVLGPRPKGLWLDRRDNDGHYEPSNVRWATPSQQNSNQRKRKPHKCAQRGRKFTYFIGPRMHWGHFISPHPETRRTP